MLVYGVLYEMWLCIVKYSYKKYVYNKIMFMVEFIFF